MKIFMVKKWVFICVGAGLLWFWGNAGATETGEWTCQLKASAWTAAQAREEQYAAFFAEISSADPESVWSRTKASLYELGGASFARIELSFAFAMHSLKQGRASAAVRFLEAAHTWIQDIEDPHERVAQLALREAFTGRVFFATNQPDCARGRYRRAIALLQQDNGPEKEKTVAYLYLLLGQDERYLGSREQADMAFIDALRVFEDVPEDRERTLGVAIVYHSLKHNNYDNRDIFLKGKIREAEAREDPSYKNRLLQALSYYEASQRNLNK